MSEYQVESEVEEEEGESKKRWRARARKGSDFLRHPILTFTDCIVFGMHCAVAQFRKMVPYVMGQLRELYHTQRQRWREGGEKGHGGSCV